MQWAKNIPIVIIYNAYTGSPGSIDHIQCLNSVQDQISYSYENGIIKTLCDVDRTRFQ